MSEARLPESDSLPLARLGLGPTSPRARAREAGAAGLGSLQARTCPPARASAGYPVPAPPLRVGAPAVPEHASCRTQSRSCLRNQPVPQWLSETQQSSQSPETYLGGKVG